MRFLPLLDVPHVAPRPAGYDLLNTGTATPHTAPYNAMSSPLLFGTCSSLSSTFTTQSKDELLTPTDVVEGSGSPAPTDSFFSFQDALPECSGHSTRRLPADPCRASPPPLYNEDVGSGSQLSLGPEEYRLPYPGQLPPTFNGSHLITALGLYIPQTDEPLRCLPRGPIVDPTMDCKPEPEQMRASRVTSAQTSYRSSSLDRQKQSESGDSSTTRTRAAQSCAVSRDSLTRSCWPRRRLSLPPPAKRDWPGEEWLCSYKDK
jgi:hypothetical protein